MQLMIFTTGTLRKILFSPNPKFQLVTKQLLMGKYPREFRDV